MCELTVHDGKVAYDLNGISRPDWRTLPAITGRSGTHAGTRSMFPLEEMTMANSNDGRF